MSASLCQVCGIDRGWRKALAATMLCDVDRATRPVKLSMLGWSTHCVSHNGLPVNLTMPCARPYLHSRSSHVSPGPSHLVELCMLLSSWKWCCCKPPGTHVAAGIGAPAKGAPKLPMVQEGQSVKARRLGCAATLHLRLTTA